MREDILIELVAQVSEKATRTNVTIEQNAVEITKFFNKYYPKVRFNSFYTDEENVKSAILDVFRTPQGEFIATEKNPFYVPCKKIADYLYEKQINNIVIEALKPREKTEEEKIIENWIKVGENLRKAVEEYENKEKEKKKKKFGLF